MRSHLVLPLAALLAWPINVAAPVPPPVAGAATMRDVAAAPSPQASPRHAADRRVRATLRRSAPAPSAPSQPGKATAARTVTLPPLLRCIRWAESRNVATAVSPDGQYRGLFQLSIQYSPVWARRYGAARWAALPADRWPVAVQDAVAVALFRDFPQAWAGDLGVCG